MSDEIALGGKPRVLDDPNVLTMHKLKKTYYDMLGEEYPYELVDPATLKDVTPKQKALPR